MGNSSEKNRSCFYCNVICIQFVNLGVATVAFIFIAAFCGYFIPVMPDDI